MIKSIAQSGTFSIGGSIASYLVTILVARNFSQDEVALYLYLVAVGALVVQFLDVAADQCAVHFARVREKSIVSVWRLLAAFKFRLLLVLLMLLAICEWLARAELPSLMLLLIVPAFYLGPIYEYRGENRNYAKLMFIERICLLAAGFFCVYLGVGIEWILVSVFLISVYSFLYQYRRCLVGGPEKADGDGRELLRYLADYFPVYLVLASQLAYGNFSRLIIESKLGAIYFASVTLALQVVNSASMIQGQIDRHVRSETMRLVADDDWSGVLSIIKKYLIFYVTPLTVASIVLGAFAEEVVSLLYGARWGAAGDALLCASPLLVSVAGMRLIDILAVALGIGRVNLSVNVAAGCGLLATLWFAPSEALVDYVLAIVAFQFLQVGVMAFYVYRKFPRQ
jgi:O-antigen/teichoic acid export membrane protein